MFLLDNMAFISLISEILVRLYSEAHLIKLCIQILEQLYYWLFETYVRQVLFVNSSHTCLKPSNFLGQDL